MSWRDIYDETTGEILYSVFGSSATITANTPTGYAAIEPSGNGPTDAATVYVDDPGGTPTLTARPEMGATIPDAMFASDPLEIANVPAGVDIEVVLNSSGVVEHTGSTVTLETYDATPASVTAGDVYFVKLTGFPYQTMTGYVTVNPDP